MNFNQILFLYLWEFTQTLQITFEVLMKMGILSSWMKTVTCFFRAEVEFPTYVYNTQLASWVYNARANSQTIIMT